jgi:hypothetical protein
MALDDPGRIKSIRSSIHKSRIEPSRRLVEAESAPVSYLAGVASLSIAIRGSELFSSVFCIHILKENCHESASPRLYAD